MRRSGSTLRRLSLILPLALLVSSCIRSKGPHVLVISVEGLRRSHLDFSGRKNAPALTDLASNCDVFERAYASELRAPLSHVAMLSGMYARQFGIDAPLPASVETLPQRLKRRNYFTVGLMQDGRTHERLGLQRGFDVFFQCNRGTEVYARMTEILATRSDSRRMFVFAHLNANAFESEASLEQPGLEEELSWRPDYEHKIRRTDELIASLIDLWDRAGLMDPVLLVVMGAHAVPSTQEESIAAPSEENLRVPLYVQWPGPRRRGQVRSDFVSHIDLVPTVLAALGLARESWLPGTPLQHSAPAGRILFAHGADSATLLRWPWKYVVGADGEYLFNLREDPFERERIALDNEPETFFHQRALLLSHVHRTSSRRPPPPGRETAGEPLLAQFGQD